MSRTISFFTPAEGLLPGPSKGGIGGVLVLQVLLVLLVLPVVLVDGVKEERRRRE